MRRSSAHSSLYIFDTHKVFRTSGKRTFLEVLPHLTSPSIAEGRQASKTLTTSPGIGHSTCPERKQGETIAESAFSGPQREIFAVSFISTKTPTVNCSGLFRVVRYRLSIFSVPFDGILIFRYPPRCQTLVSFSRACACFPSFFSFSTGLLLLFLRLSSCSSCSCYLCSGSLSTGLPCFSKSHLCQVLQSVSCSLLLFLKFSSPIRRDGSSSSISSLCQSISLLSLKRIAPFFSIICMNGTFRLFNGYTGCAPSAVTHCISCPTVPAIPEPSQELCSGRSQAKAANESWQSDPAIIVCSSYWWFFWFWTCPT